MKRRIVILVDGADQEQRDAITMGIKRQRVGYWHWFQEAWLVIDKHNRALTFWRDLVLKRAPGVHVLVLPVDPRGGWSGLASRKAYPWLHDSWARSKASEADEDD